jgi:ribosomal protein S15P/S13E
MSDYLKEIGKLNENAEFENAEKKVSKIEEHLQSNPQDKKTKHKLQKARSKLESARKNLAKK